MKLSKDNMIITMDTEIGANGEEIARALSDMLRIPCYGAEILDKAAELSGIPAAQLHRYDGKPVHAAYDLLADDDTPLRMRPAADFITAQVAACRALAAQGSCILVDRHASMALEGTENLVRIYVHADFEDRAARVSGETGKALEETRRSLHREDRTRRSYYRGNHKGWGEADSYDLSVNASDADAATLAGTVLGFLRTMAGELPAEQRERKAV